MERVEQDLRHHPTVRVAVHLRVRQRDSVVVRCNVQLVEERVVTDFLCVVPVVDDVVIDGVFQRDDPTLRLRLVADVGVLLTEGNSTVCE